MPASLEEVLGGLLVLLLALTVTGLSILRVIEALLRHRFPLTPVERAVVAFYTSGFFLFLLASIPAPIYGRDLVASVLLAGTALYVYLLVRERASGARTVLGILGRPTPWLLTGGFLGLLLFETAPVWAHPFPNAWDGSVTALWSNLILRNNTVPSTLQPFASAPVLYPMATSVWMTVPVILLGWSVVQSPILLPPLFLSLTIPAAYAWGSRWWRGPPQSSSAVGLVFAAFFGAVASWPRLYTGGWYDFALALPLLLLATGFLPELAGQDRPTATTTIGFGLLCGALTTLSLAAGETIIVLLVAFVLVHHRGSGSRLVTHLSQAVVFVVFELAFSARSIWEWATANGASYVPSAYYGPLNLRLIQGELDPFVPMKLKMSPFPVVGLELQILLVIGLLLALVLWIRPQLLPSASEGVPLATFLLVGMATSFLMTAFLLLTGLPGAFWVHVRSVTNLGQSSIILFIFFQGIALFPLALAASSLASRVPHSHPAVRPVPSEVATDKARSRPWRLAPGSTRGRPAALALLVAIPLALGFAVSAIDGPSYIQNNVEETSNVTPGDVSALQWAGAHLPACSTVLVAPGSAAQFLPEYASVRVAFPMNPVPSNRSYDVAVANLTQGTYSSVTRQALVALSITEVFVTGATSVSYPPFSPQPLLSSPDFSLVFSSGDAEIFAFLPVTGSAHCSG